MYLWTLCGVLKYFSSTWWYHAFETSFDHADLVSRRLETQTLTLHVSYFNYLPRTAC